MEDLKIKDSPDLIPAFEGEDFKQYFDGTEESLKVYSDNKDICLVDLDNDYIFKEQEQNIIFHQKDSETPILELKENGDIYVKGKLIENDKQVVDAMREFLGLEVNNGKK